MTEHVRIARKDFVVVTLFAWAALSAHADQAWAQSGAVAKVSWNLENGNALDGDHVGFGDHWIWLSRRWDKFFINGNEIDKCDPVLLNLVQKLLQNFSLPNLGNKKALGKFLATLRAGGNRPAGVQVGPAEVGFRFYTVKLSTRSGPQEVPCCLLAKEDREQIIEEFKAWEQQLLAAEQQQLNHDQLLQEMRKTNMLLDSIQRALWRIAVQ